MKKSRQLQENDVTARDVLQVGIISVMADSYGRKPAILVGLVAALIFPLSVAIIPVRLRPCEI
jgi:hypothetical protein